MVACPKLSCSSVGTARVFKEARENIDVHLPVLEQAM